MGLLLLIGILVLVYWLVRRPASETNYISEDQLTRRNKEWAAFIVGYRSKAKNKSAKALLEQMLDDVRTQGLPVPEEYGSRQSATSEQNGFTEDDDRIEPAKTAAMAASVQAQPAIVLHEHKTQLDNTTLLLYFGAFLFVASVGLFIAFGGASGLLRTLAVFLVMAVMYSSGIWLFHNRPKLKPAGLAFAGIGIAIAPLVGLAAYNYLLIGQGSTAWFMTSALCMVMYSHALVTLRHPLVNYIFIFTFLSLFESGISIASAPIYYFGWAMAVAGMALRAASMWKDFWPELQESSRSGAQLFLPLALLVSVVLVPMQGLGQLGVSLLLAAIFYGLEAVSSSGQERETNAVVAHIALLSGFSCLVYALTHSWTATALGLLVLNAIQAAGIYYVPRSGALAHNYASILLLASAVDVLMSIEGPLMIMAAVISVVIFGLLVWLRQKRADAYGLAAIAWTALPVVYGQLVLGPSLKAVPQAALLYAALLSELAVMLYYRSKNIGEQWLETAQVSYMFTAVAVTLAALFAGPEATLAAGAGVALSMLILAEKVRESDWAVVGGFAACAGLINSWQRPGLLLGSIVLALLYNIAVTLRYKQELNRWLSTALWLLLPVGLGGGVIGGSQWGPAGYAWAYTLAMAGLIFSRAIARGEVFFSKKASMASYAKDASVSYVIGYAIAAGLALLLSLMSADSQVHTSLITLVLIIAVIQLSVNIEKRADMTSFVPLLGQFLLWSAIRSGLESSTLTAYLLASTALAAAGYYFGKSLVYDKQTGSYAEYFRGASLIAVFITPLAVMFTSQTVWPMPFGLLIAGLLMYDHVRSTSQQNREMAGGLIVLSVMWMMWFAGIHNLQAYTHVAALTLGLYAYWRSVRGEAKQSDDYLTAMLATATVPLVLQALGGEGGGVYGWWLLLEQIFFMLLGMMIRKRRVVFWGLYVAIGAVLYQLRDLGWAALTVLAVFIIGIALYQLQKHEDKSN